MTQTTLFPARVLVVEHDRKLAALLCRALSGGGLDADAAFEGELALERLGTGHYAAAILDVGLPGLDGFEVCARLRSGGSAMPVVMLRAHDSVDDLVAGLRSRATDFLRKPFSLDELVARLTDLVRDTRSLPAP